MIFYLTINNLININEQSKVIDFWKFISNWKVNF